jgi:galactokinase
MSLQDRVIAEFKRHYGTPPTFVVRAPGRVNLIGEHTDYNDGFVLPMAIDRAMWIALRPRVDDQVRARSLDFDETIDFKLSALHKGAAHWSEYLKGIAWALQQAGNDLRGFEGIVAGDIPIGAGRRRRPGSSLQPGPFQPLRASPGTPLRWPCSVNAPRTNGWASTAASWIK